MSARDEGASLSLGDSGYFDLYLAEAWADWAESEEDPTVLAELSWDLGPGGGGSPLNDDSGCVVLLRSEGDYYSVSDADGLDVTPLPASSDAEAIERFSGGLG